MPFLRFPGPSPWLFLLSLAFFPAGCGGRRGPQHVDVSATDTLQVKYAGGFRLERGKGILRAEVIRPWQGDGQATMTYILSPSQKRSKNPGGTVPVTVPVHRVICTSTTHVAFLRALGQSSSIVGISGKGYVYDPSVRKRIADGTIRDIGYDKNMNYELILQLRPDVVFLYGIGPEVKSTIDRLASLGIPAVMVGDYLEETPLGRAEWIRFFGAFFGVQDRAERWIDSVAARYENLARNKERYTNMPVVMTGLPWNEIWYVPGGKTLTAALIRDAGGRYVWEDTGSRDALPMDIEKVYRKAGRADVWINCGSASSLAAILATDKRLGLFRPFRTGNVYNNDARLSPGGGNDYWESGVIHPDIILEDLQQIFHPGSHPERKMVYYRKIQ